MEQAGTAGTRGTAPDRFVVRLDTTKGPIVVECFRDWAPNGADRFHELVTSGYFNDSAIFRIRPKTWAQFGINGDPKVSQAWRPRTITDDPFQPQHGSERGTVFFAWAVPNGRTTVLM
jgi:cyclophilin family peptidyl-prolyl cis-trans isomerase